MAQLWLTIVACNLLKSWLARDCRRVLKHVSKSYNFYRVVCDNLGEVVRLNYTRQSVSYGRGQVACDSRKSRLCRLNRGLKPRPNGTPNSSQLEPSYKIKTYIDAWPNDTAKSSQLARNHSIVWLRPCSHITIAKQLGESWLSLMKFKPTRANSTQVGGQTIFNSIELVNLTELAWVGRIVWPGLCKANCLRHVPWEVMQCYLSKLHCVRRRAWW